MHVDEDGFDFMRYVRVYNKMCHVLSIGILYMLICMGKIV